MNILEKTIMFISPRAAARRARDRYILDVISRKYEGAGTGRRFNGWSIKGGTSANAEIGTSTKNLRDRARDLVRNNPYASRAITAIASNTVGTGIVPQLQGKKPKQIEKVSALWNDFAETTYCDVDGRHDFYGLQSLVMRATPESGEIFARRVYIKPKKPTDLNFKIQLLEADFLDNLKNETLKSGNYIINGIEFNKSGERVAYWMFDEHPGGQVTGKKATNTSMRIDAKDIIHVFRPDRPGQYTGVSWLAPVIVRLRDFDDFEDAHLMAKKISSCFGVFVTSQDDDTGGDDDNAELSLEPGIVQTLKPGQQIQTANPPSIADYGDYSRITLQAVATGLGITYECLTSDLSHVNFSSGRMGWLEFQRNIKFWRSQMLIPIFCMGVWKWFEEAALLAGVDTTGVSPYWVEPAREMIDPVKEAEAEKTLIRMGRKSLTQSILEAGGDPEKVFQSYKEERERFKKDGLIFDSDAATDAGGFPAPISKENKDGGLDEND
jgi:lambda family phage portal protein